MVVLRVIVRDMFTVAVSVNTSQNPNINPKPNQSND